MAFLLRNWLVDKLMPRPSIQSLTAPLDVSPMRARPGQRLDAMNYLYATGPEAVKYVATYAYSAWVHVAISKLAAAAVAAQLRVFDRNEPASESKEHPLLALIGPYGKPNDAQDSAEFLEEHLTNRDLAGNSYWYWFGGGGGVPTQVYNLDPQKVYVVPGSTSTVGGYLYRHMGQEFKLQPEEVTHFRGPNPFSPYYGLSALQALMTDVLGDRSMAQWNFEFFGDGVAMPAGAWVIPDSVSDAEKERFSDEINAKHAQQRRTAVIRAEAGSVAWYDAGLKHRDLDFKDGRMLARKVIFNAFDLPEGLYSEASTEAHARVAERLYYGSVQRRLDRTASKLNSDIMGFWPGGQRWVCGYLDLRQRFADWQQEQMHVETLLLTHSVDEVRADVYNRGPAPEDFYGRGTEAQDGEAVGSGYASGQGADSGGSGKASSDQRQPVHERRYRQQEHMAAD